MAKPESYMVTHYDSLQNIDEESNKCIIMFFNRQATYKHHYTRKLDFQTGQNTHLILNKQNNYY